MLRENCKKIGISFAFSIKKLILHCLLKFDDMKTKLLFCFLVVFCLMAVSCVDKKQKPLGELRKFATELEMNSGSYTDEEWNNASAKYDRLVTDIEQYKYSDEELREIGYLKGKCAGYFTKRAVKEIGDGINSAAQQFVGAVQGFVDAINDGLSDMSTSSSTVDTTAVE